MEIFWGDRRHDQIKQYIERTVENDHDNDLANFEKDPIFYLYLRKYVFRVKIPGPRFFQHFSSKFLAIF